MDLATWWTERDLEENYDEMLDGVYGTVQIAGFEVDTSRALRVVDPIAYRVGMSDYADSVMEEEDIKIEGWSE